MGYVLVTLYCGKCDEFIKEIDGCSWSHTTQYAN